MFTKLLSDILTAVMTEAQDDAGLATHPRLADLSRVCSTSQFCYLYTLLVMDTLTR